MAHPSVKQLWDRYRAAIADAPSEPPIAEHFSDNKADANRCADLIRTGIKRATASAWASYQEAGEILPAPGKLLIVTNWSGEAQGMIRTLTVTVCRFGDVPAAFAMLEGEGDGTLTWWREEHRAFWERTLPGHVIDDDFLVVCEEFELIATA